MSRRSSHRKRRPKTCLFCGAAGPLSEEHIFGAWLRRLGYDGPAIREIGYPAVVQEGGAFSKTIKMVCKECNNGWMSELEEEVKPLLIGMFNSHGTSIRLDEDSQLSLARWAFKTAAVVVYADKTQSDPFPEAHRREIYRTTFPPRQAQIWIGQASMPIVALKGEHLVDYHFQPSLANVGGRETDSFPFYRATFRLINVVFDIMGYVSDRFTMDGEPTADLGKAIHSIWPVRYTKIWWPPTRSLDAFGGARGLIDTKLTGIPTLTDPKRS